MYHIFAIFKLIYSWFDKGNYLFWDFERSRQSPGAANWILNFSLRCLRWRGLAYNKGCEKSRGDQVLFCCVFFLVSVFYYMFLFHFFPLRLFCVYSLYISSPVARLLGTLVGPQRMHHPLPPFSTHKGSEKNSYSIFLFYFCFPLLSVYFRVVSCDFKTYFYSMRF